jgi:hypothetical protein
MNSPFRLSLAGLITLALAGLALPALAAQLTSTSSDPAVRGLINGGTINKVPTTVTTSITSSISVAPSVSPDAIAIRIFDNADNLSPRAWYTKNIGARRSLQSLLVDGYDAVRDDRTVYVAAANIAPCQGRSAGPSCLKPIIVIVSFNQNISNETVDIFGQILANWRFNQNINGQPGVCSNGGGNLSCLSDQDCQSGQICDSLKARVVRDTRRLIDLSAMKTKLEQYRQSYQRYPSLESGTYLANKTLSVWPSWQKTLAVKMGAALPIDPINRLGVSPAGHNQTTGWNEQQRSFATVWPALPEGSRVYQYELVNNTRYTLCANFETNYQNITNYGCAGNHENQGPVINCPVMRGAAGQAFSVYAEIFDNEGDAINSTINYNQLGGWSHLNVQLVNSGRQLKISATTTGPDGRYDLTLNTSDNLGATSTKTCSIIIGNGLCGNDLIDPNEDCEGNLGVAANASDSNPGQQYSCNQYCRFTGGWCGDNIIQNGQNFTVNREQCDGSNGVATKTNDSSPNRQYACHEPTNPNACTLTGGYCGDHIVQTNTNIQVNEDCDRSTDSPNPDPGSTYNGIKRYQCGQPGTVNACKFTGGYCGDSVVDYGYGETCEESTYVAPTTANSSSTKQYACLGTTCQVTGGWCGDGYIQTSTNTMEICDCSGNSKNCAWAGNANSANPDPTATSSPSNSHRCQNCIQTGGWCGDGIVQAQSEKCDPLEPLSVFKSRTGNTNIDQSYYEQFITACATQNCQTSCYDQDGDGYGINKYNNCANTAIDCEDRPLGSDGLINSADDGPNINPGQPDNCTQYDGLDNNCNGYIDDKAWLYTSPLWSDSFNRDVLNPAVSTNGSFARSTIDTTIGATDSRSAKIEQDSQSTAPSYIWPNVCNNINYNNNNNCAAYGGKSLTGLTWDITNVGLNINQSYVLRFKYRGSANFLHPTTTSQINQIHWGIGNNPGISPSSLVASTSNLIAPGNYPSFSTRPYLGSFTYYQNLNQLAGGMYLSILVGQNNLPGDGNTLNVDDLSLTSCQNIRPDNTYCGNGIIEGAYETCDFNMAEPNWDEATEFCDDSCQRGRRLRILQIYPGDSNTINLQNIINNNKDNYITRTATITAVSLANFNNSSSTYIPINNPTSSYNVVVFGFKDCNGSSDGTNQLAGGRDLSPAAASSTQRFINAGGGVIFGHDTIWQESGTVCGGNHSNFNSLAHYAGISLANYQNTSNGYNNISKNINQSSTPASALMFNKPYVIDDSFAVKFTHTSGSLPNQSLCSSPDGLKIWLDGGDINTKFWATTCGRVEHIMLGHTASTTIGEQRAMINMFYYVATH